jgi:XTP/dITP diphosphohydrolase
MKIYLVTTNTKKLLTASSALSKFGVDLEMLSVDYEVPEIQSYSVEEIAKFSAAFVSKKEGKPVLVTDVGYFIESLNGFPGPFVKQMNHYLSSEDLLKLMEGKANRKFEMIECLAFCIPGEEPVTFISKNNGTISLRAEGEGSAIDRVMIREGLDKVQSLYPLEDMIKYYEEKMDQYTQFGEYYKNYLK